MLNNSNRNNVVDNKRSKQESEDELLALPKIYD